MVDSEIDEDIADTVITTDNVKLGEVEGDYMRQYATEESQIAIIGHVEGSSTAIEREEGVRKALESMRTGSWTWYSAIPITIKPIC